MSEEQWAAVDDYLVSELLPPDDALDRALAASAAEGLPSIQVSPAQGRLLEILARAQRARSILEIGTLGGYSTIWLARALPPGGRLITLELDAHHADVARRNIARAGLEQVVQIRVGPALDSLRALAAERREPFDFIFIDADKTGYPEYFRHSLTLSRRGTMIIADNVVREGAVADAASDDPNVRAVRTLIGMMANEARVISTVLQTVGSKGYDGFSVALVIGDTP
jgi:predicted O-methyltransferase YrrM